MVIKTPINSRKTQIWYFDAKTKSIRSRDTGAKSFDIVKKGKSFDMQVWKTGNYYGNADWW